MHELAATPDQGFWYLIALLIVVLMGANAFFIKILVSQVLQTKEACEVNAKANAILGVKMDTVLTDLKDLNEGMKEIGNLKTDVTILKTRVFNGSGHARK